MTRLAVSSTTPTNIVGRIPYIRIRIVASGETARRDVKLRPPMKAYCIGDDPGKTSLSR
jgi:hypothetical protein